MALLVREKVRNGGHLFCQLIARYMEPIITVPLHMVALERGEQVFCWMQSRQHSSRRSAPTGQWQGEGAAVLGFVWAAGRLGSQKQTGNGRRSDSFLSLETSLQPLSFTAQLVPFIIGRIPQLGGGGRNTICSNSPDTTLHCHH